MKRRIVLLGPPASGKGTQAEMIHARYQIPVTSPGAVLREEKKAGTALGIEAEKATSQGRLVPDDVVNEVVEKWLSQHDAAFIFDGYPRSLGQAEALTELLAERNAPLDIVLSLEADEQTIRDRVGRRLMCNECGRIVSTGLHVAGAGDRCPTCGGELTRRLDDTPEALTARLEEYAEKTEPLIGYYRERGLLRAVNAARTPEVVFDSVAKILEDE